MLSWFSCLVTYPSYSQWWPVVHAALDAEPPGATAFKIHRKRFHNFTRAPVQSKIVQCNFQLVASPVPVFDLASLLNNWGCHCQAWPLKSDASWPLTPQILTGKHEEEETCTHTHTPPEGRRRRTAVVSRWLELWLGTVTVLDMKPFKIRPRHW